MTKPTRSSFPLALQPALLTATAVALAGGLALFYSWPLTALALLPLPVALVILWVACDVPTPQERIAAVDLGRATQRANPPEAPAMSRAA